MSDPIPANLKKEISFTMTKENSAIIYALGCRYLAEWKNKYAFINGEIDFFTLLDITYPENAMRIWGEKWREESNIIFVAWQDEKDWEKIMMDRLHLSNKTEPKV